jgi:hypothetical protein
VPSNRFIAREQYPEPSAHAADCASIACPSTSDAHRHGRPHVASGNLGASGAITGRRYRAADAEVVEPLAHLVVIVQEVAVRAGGEVDAMKKIKSPPDDLVADRASGRAGAPLGRPPVRLVACTRACQHGGEPCFDLVTVSTRKFRRHEPRVPHAL